MMRRSESDGGSSSRGSSSAASEEWAAAGEVEGWEIRPGGMMVQKRGASAGHEGAAPPPLPEMRVRVTHGLARYEVSVSSIATFGEMKKLLTAETGLRPAEQRLLYRGKEKNDRDYLDRCGVKNKSKIVLIEDPTSLEKKYVEMQKNARIQSAHRAIDAVSVEIDKLAEQVTMIGRSIGRGSKVTEVQITTLIELLMRQAVRIDSIKAEGDAASQKHIQSKRVQKCVETLDALKVSNARLKSVIVTTKWETFDPPPTTTKWEIFD